MMLLTIGDDDRLSLFILHPLNGIEGIRHFLEKASETTFDPSPQKYWSPLVTIFFGSFPNIPKKYISLPIHNYLYHTIRYRLLMYVSRDDSS